jgi:hypothetical protein
MQRDKLKQAYSHTNMIANDSCAVVIFTNDNSFAWARWLAPGFRHCFIAIESKATWVILDTLSNRINVWTIPLCPANDLSAWYQRRGYQTIITTQKTPPENAAPWALITCVETIKRLLGIHRATIHTPKQLFNFLITENNP